MKHFAGGVIGDYGVFDGGIRTYGGSAGNNDGNILFTGRISTINSMGYYLLS